MGNRIRHFRAGLLLVLASAFVFWPISYWLPLGEYLGVLNTAEYADYQLFLKSVLAIYLVFFILNLVTAGVTATKINSQVKFWLALVPAALLVATPFLLAIPIALKFSDRNYLEVLGALYRLLRFTKPELLVMVFACTIIAAGLNVFAALVIRKATVVEKVNTKVRNRYFIYAGAMAALLAIVVSFGSVNANNRSLDRAACNDYAALAAPQLDGEIDGFISELLVIGESAGSESVRSAFATFSSFFRQFSALLDTDIDEGTLSQYQVQVSASKNNVIALCSEFAVK